LDSEFRLLRPKLLNSGCGIILCAAREQRAIHKRIDIGAGKHPEGVNGKEG